MLTWKKFEELYCNAHEVSHLLNDEERREIIARKISRLKERKVTLKSVPVVKDLEKKILRAVQKDPSTLDMAAWHRFPTYAPDEDKLIDCGTTHCRAGWAVALAGKKGRDLENKMPADVGMAGALIYAKSTGRIPDFFASGEEAIADITFHATNKSNKKKTK